jgi:hypothetical protein
MIETAKPAGMKTLCMIGPPLSAAKPAADNQQPDHAVNKQFDDHFLFFGAVCLNLRDSGVGIE